MTSPRRERLLRIVEPPRPTPAQQLGLLGLEPARATLISVSARALHTSHLLELLHRYRPRQIVDIRMSPSFRGLDLTEGAFLNKLSALLVSYRTCPSLANRYAGYSWDPQRMWHLYSKHLDEQSAELRRLREDIEQGPVTLVSTDERHDISDRKYVIEALLRIRQGFDVVIDD